MTSHQYTGRTGKTEVRGPRRGIVKRGILPSFGDIVLPIVTIAAIGLLILAGRQFFLNGMKTSPGMSSTRAYAEAPALIAEREQKEQRERTEAAETNAVTVAEVKGTAPVSAEAAAKPEVQDDTSFAAVAEILAEPQKTKKITVTTSPAPAPKKTTATTTPAPKKTANTAAATLPANKQWRVQVGAYGTKDNAQKEADKIKKAGYKATVYSNPASKYVKVWVQGGADKASAEKVVNAMKKMGYKSSFSFPPAK